MFLSISILLVLTAFFVYQYVTFIKIYYIGQSLHKLRELRLELTSFLSANVKKDLPAQEASEYYHFLIVVNLLIKYFDVVEPKFTQFNSVKDINPNIILTSEQLTSRSNSTLVDHRYINKFRDGILTAFKAIPFCRLRLSMSIKLGMLHSSHHLSILERLYNTEKGILKKKGIPCNP